METEVKLIEFYGLIITSILGFLSTVIAAWIAAKKHSEAKTSNNTLVGVKQVYDNMVDVLNKQNTELMNHSIKSSKIINDLHDANTALLSNNYNLSKENFTLRMEMEKLTIKVQDIQTVVDTITASRNITGCGVKDCPNRTKIA